MKKRIRLTETELINQIEDVIKEQEQGGADEFWSGLLSTALGLSPRERQRNINNAVCSLENGIIKNPNSQLNGTKWSDFAKLYKVKNGEYNLALIYCQNKKYEISEKTKLISVLKDVLNKSEKNPKADADKIYEEINKELNDYKNKTGKFNIFIK